VPLDTRTLDYRPYFDEGEMREAPDRAYTSHNTNRLDIDATVELLKTLPEIMSLTIGKQP
jgi:UDP-glucose 4-epimerase